MQDYRWRLLGMAAPYLLLSLALWPLAGFETSLLLLLTVAVVYLLRHLFWLQQLQLWLKKPDISQIPLAYYAKENDLTKRVIEEFNRTYKPKK